MIPSRKAIMAGMEKLQKDQSLRFTIPNTFGGGVALIQLNPEAGKRYILKVAKDLETARSFTPLLVTRQDQAHCQLGCRPPGRHHVVTRKPYQAPAALVATFYLFLIAWTFVAVLFLAAKAARSETGDILQLIMIIGVLCFTWYFSLGIFYRIRLEADGSIFLAGVRRTLRLHPREHRGHRGALSPDRLHSIQIREGKILSPLLG